MGCCSAISDGQSKHHATGGGGCKLGHQAKHARTRSDPDPTHFQVPNAGAGTELIARAHRQAPLCSDPSLRPPTCHPTCQAPIPPIRIPTHPNTPNAYVASGPVAFLNQPPIPMLSTHHWPQQATSGAARQIQHSASKACQTNSHSLVSDDAANRGIAPYFFSRLPAAPSRFNNTICKHGKVGDGG